MESTWPAFLDLFLEDLIGHGLYLIRNGTDPMIICGAHLFFRIVKYVVVKTNSALDFIKNNIL